MARLQLALLLALAACALAQDNNNTFYEQSGISVTTEDAVLMQGVWAHTYTWPTAYFGLDGFNAALLAQNASGNINVTAAFIQGLAILDVNATLPPGIPDWYIVIAGVTPFAGHMGGFFVLASGPDSILDAKEFVGISYKQDGLLQFQIQSRDMTMQARAALATAPDGSDVFHVTLTKLDMDGQTSQMDFVNTTFIGSQGYLKDESWPLNDAVGSLLKWI